VWEHPPHGPREPRDKPRNVDFHREIEDPFRAARTGLASFWPAPLLLLYRRRACRLPEEPEVDDDFMMHLRDHGIDTTGGFAFTDIGLVDARGTFTPSHSQVKLQKYGVPNTLHEIYLTREGRENLYDLDTLRRSLPVTIRWLNDNVRGDGGGKPRILVNIVDGCDAFAEDPGVACEILSLLAEQPIEGISLEDDRGTYMPFQVGAYVAAARSLLPPPVKLVVHVHTGGGFENASLIEALLQGADGVWGALPKRAAIIGHASLGELIANLIRVGIPIWTRIASVSSCRSRRRCKCSTTRSPFPTICPSWARTPIA
jgi:HMGL-like